MCKYFFFASLLPFLFISWTTSAAPPANPNTIICSFIPEQGLDDLGVGRVFAELTKKGKRYHFVGRMGTPTPNYRAEFGSPETNGTQTNVSLRLISPYGTQLTVIDTVDLDAYFDIPSDAKTLHVNIEPSSQQSIVCLLRDY